MEPTALNPYFEDIKQLLLDESKREKNDMKQTLISYDLDRAKELDDKKKEVKEKKNYHNKNLKESMEKYKKAKMNDYENMQKEKKFVLAMIEARNKKFDQYGRENVNKIKKERERSKINETKRQKYLEKTSDNFNLLVSKGNKEETNKLKDKLERLEKLEAKYIESLNKQRNVMKRNNSLGKFFIKKDMIEITKLDLEQNFDKPFLDKGKISNKNNQKNYATLDNNNKKDNNEN